MSEVYSFEHIFSVEDEIISTIIRKMSSEEIAMALIRESMIIRKRFYKNMPTMDTWNTLNDDLKALSNSELYKKLKEKRQAQSKMMSIMAEYPEYQNARFQVGFDNLEDFKTYLMQDYNEEEFYGLCGQDIPFSSFFIDKDAAANLEKIKQKNKADKISTIPLAGTNIQFINYSVCPKCASIYSYKELSAYYLKPNTEPEFKMGVFDQMRHDARMFCAKCSSYFIPSLLLIDEKPRKEVQFLGKVQTMNAIEEYYQTKGISVLTQDYKNLVKTDGVHVRPIIVNKESVIKDFLTEIFTAVTQPDTEKGILKGIKNDVLLKEIEEKPSLICNLLQHTPSDIAPNLIDGSNAVKGDVLYGMWK